MRAALRPLFELWDHDTEVDDLRRRASAAQIELFAVHVTHADIVNGGVRQWLWNWPPSVHRQAVRGHRRLGLPEVSDLLRAVVDLVLPDGPGDLAGLRDRLVDDPRDDGSSAFSASLDAAGADYLRLTGEWGPGDDPFAGQPLVEPALRRWVVDHQDEFFVAPAG